MPTLVRQSPSGPGWLHEIKHDGYRAMCLIDHGEVSIYTRRARDWADRMPGIAQAGSPGLSPSTSPSAAATRQNEL